MMYFLIGLKLLIVASYASMVYLFGSFAMNNRNSNLKLDLLSSLAISAGIGLALVCLVAKLTPSTYTFTAILCILSLALTQFQRRRIVLVSKSEVLLKGKVYPLKAVKDIKAWMLWAYITMDDGKKTIYVPLSSREMMDNLK